MAISSLSFACRPSFPFRPSLFHRIQKVRFSSVAAIKTLDVQENVIKGNSRNLGDFKAPEWRKLSSKELGIGNSLISGPTKKVLNGLKKKGYEVYLVGGCVRDLILKRIPKDFDIITSAELKEVVRAFSRCEIVGKWFHIHCIDLVEVSSFSTIGRKFKVGLRNDIGCPIDCDEKDYLRWKNCLQRDFTINGLMFDPYKRIVYDYMGGLEDIKKAKVRTVIPANISFQEDRARILRAVRIAARLGFRFTRETICHFYSLLRLDKPRIMMEMNYMLAYGSAEASLRILWKFGLLELLLPFQAAYFVRDGFKRRDKRSNMLLVILLFWSLIF
uniref:Poly A polymerase head domain-containing protein n=1 Tax=Salix viminalis TaxID=40686 RepID=A0A6N2MDP5_SALVM